MQIEHDLIFKDELIDKFYKVTYSQGSTELQETRGFEKDDNGNVTNYKVRNRSYFFRSPKFFDMYDTFERVKRVAR